MTTPETTPRAAPGAPTAAALAKAFHPFDIADPFDFYARAREEAPVFYSPELDYWVVTRYRDIQAVFRDPQSFSSEVAQAPYRPRPAAVQEILGELTSRSGLLGTQPPDHTRLRSFVNKAFTPRRVAVLEPRVRELAVEMIERMAPRGRADWVAELTYDLPALVIFILLGIPGSDVPRVKRWAQSRVQLNFGDDLPEEEQVEHAHNVVAYWHYCEALIEARFAEPADDLPSDLVRVYQEGDRSLTRQEMAGLVFTQLTAGHETTTALLSTGLLELLRRRERWEAVCEDPGLVHPTVEELLRLCSPVLAVKRKVKRPARVGEVEVPEGAKLLLVVGSANHDPAVFSDPEDVDLRRRNTHQHLAFGHGIHYCLGAPLARLEAEVVLQELSARLPEARLVPGQGLAFSRNTTFRGPTALLVEWGPAA
jgi:cytochrome P450